MNLKSEIGNRKSKIRLLGGVGLLWIFVLGGCASTGGSKHSTETITGVQANSFVLDTNPAESGNWKIVHENDFSSYAIGQEPEDLFILDGEFSVREVENNKLLSLPGAPIGDFGILFGPRLKGKPVELRCRVFSTRKGRRMPAFVAGIGGLNGFRLRIDCAAGRVRLIRGEEVLSEVPFAWKSGAWTHLRFRVEPMEGEGAKVFGKAWTATDKEPLDWALVHESKESFVGGKCVLWGIPYASSEILFDDLKVFSLTQ